MWSYEYIPDVKLAVKKASAEKKTTNNIMKESSIQFGWWVRFLEGVGRGAGPWAGLGLGLGLLEYCVGWL